MLTPFFQGIIWLTLETPPTTEADRERSALLSRLADALEVLPSGHPLVEEAVGWKDRPDLAELLDVWEAGRHPIQLRTASRATSSGGIG